MKFTVSTVALLVSAVAGAAVMKREVAAAAKSDISVANPEAVVGIQAITHLYVCTDADFKGDCSNRETNTGECRNLIARFQDNISSAGPDVGTTCVLWEHVDCKGRSLTITNPGVSNLHSIGFGDLVSSYRCT